MKKGALFLIILSLVLMVAGGLLAASIFVSGLTSFTAFAPKLSAFIASVLSSLIPAVSFSDSPVGLYPLAILAIGWGVLVLVCRKKPLYIWVFPMSTVMAVTLYLLVWSVRHPQVLHPLLQLILGTGMDSRESSLVVLLAFIIEVLLLMVLTLLSRMIMHRKKRVANPDSPQGESSVQKQHPAKPAKTKKKRRHGTNEIPDEATVTFRLDENGKETYSSMGSREHDDAPAPLVFPDLSSAPRADSLIKNGRTAPYVETPEPLPARRKVSRASDITDALFSAPTSHEPPPQEEVPGAGKKRSTFMEAALSIAEHKGQPVASTKIFHSGQLAAAVDRSQKGQGGSTASLSGFRNKYQGRSPSSSADVSKGFTLADVVTAAESRVPGNHDDGRKNSPPMSSAQSSWQQAPVGAIPSTRRSSSEFKPADPAPVTYVIPVETMPPTEYKVEQKIEQKIEQRAEPAPMWDYRHSTAQPIGDAENIGDPLPVEVAHDGDSDEDMVSGIGWLSSSNAGNSALYNRSKLMYQFPSPSLLTTYPEQANVIDDTIRAQGEQLIETLRQFKVEASLINIAKGPTVTMFEVALAPGIRVNAVMNLADNIALNLAARQVRIQAPIPGKQAVGIEVPNKKRDTIGFKELLPAMDAQEFAIPMVLGKTITGRPVAIDLAATPHLLIAGSTGSGKSVCVNSLICSLLYRRTPKQVRLILVDPKVVELTIYNGIPHLLTPVITEAKKTIKALNFCLAEMERRYRLLQSLGARNIKAYNKKLQTERIAREKLPYIVVIIDEFADIMLTLGKDLEGILSRLAAMSRAVGIHLVLATQRPSMDVITGTIKSNIPSRIAFAVTSNTNSRIIIDEGGAEKLLGKGDMLYMSNTDPIPSRIQGTFLSDEEVEAIASYARTQGEPDYLDEAIFEDDEPESTSSGDSGEDLGDDDEAMMRRALEIVVERKCASASFLQRRLKIGYNRAARLVEEMEEMGYVGPANGSKPRELLRYPD
ncbi:DNA translocase FtsK [Parasphaerochaeta coccoides]|uniref:Cell division protein FtsK/SpoIIIE n=1 Tax=Parasphaerochaeta coccoides (strain ATCC BAA-1237 / DSM 17374 / SPN1) TaxID=760011 RepID=F4GM63_PARC1|nr:DNA translocase FtsK [Parasphaerochaeta coccoides]AEC02538.1 cell division protein FtsK/SpoIIIE [Parasphaerochaeta coccoides DSM 17374]